MEDKLIMSKKELRRKSILDLVKEEQLTQVEASKRLGLSYRQTKRIYQAYLKEGDEGLIHKSRGRVSSRARPLSVKKAVLSLYQTKYEDFGATLAAEKLEEEDNIKLHAETLRLWLIEAGIWQGKRQRKAYHKKRARRLKFGELLQLDGSIHVWFTGKDEKQCLMNLVDDATGKTLALLASGETTEAAFRLLKRWIEKHGIPMAIYVDLKSLYISPKSLCDDDEALVEYQWLTHFSRACEQLGIEIIKAYSPQAKGRVERNHAVYQDRFVKELRLKGITTLEGANQLLEGGFIDKLNHKFMKAPQSHEDAHVKLTKEYELEHIFCWEYTRTLSNDWVIRFENQYLQVLKNHDVKPKQKLTVKKHLGGNISLWSHGQNINYQPIEALPRENIKTAKPYTSAQRSQNARMNKAKTPWGQFNDSWKTKAQSLQVGAAPI